ncbi:tRNA uridine-5-carboxymethylaminomethyl(34) synthesis GTPase MnmE [bacterium]|nr:tRNA uridine-5-carboxymethylaminomethyl(34) synthesis GTPase MnmE [bacterium]
MYFDRINSTICALATAKESSIGIIRVSGSKAFKIASKLTGKTNFEHRKADFVKIYDGEKVVEKCLILTFHTPFSFTGEDVAEFHVHGAAENAEEILKLIVKNGAIPALKGEFSFRAVINSKMSVDEALALNTVITSENPYATDLSRKAAFEKNSVDRLKNLIPEWEYFHTLATAVVDFPDQVSTDIDFEKLKNLINRSNLDISKVSANSKALEKFLDYQIIILGKPNVGKSSLFNILVGQERAIVADIPGTTRDYISETFYAKGFQANLTDSAGLRITDSEIEAKGIEKSRNLLEKGDLLILLFDGSKPLDEEDREILRETRMKSRLIVKNKCDFAQAENTELADAVEISCKNGTGIDVLTDKICENIEKNMPDKNEAVFFSDWQKRKADETVRKLEELKLYLDSDQIEIILFLINEIFTDIRDLSGNLTSHDVYDKIFGGFCLGK